MEAFYELGAGKANGGIAPAHLPIGRMPPAAPTLLVKNSLEAPMHHLDHKETNPRLGSAMAAGRGSKLLPESAWSCPQPKVTTHLWTTTIPSHGRLSRV